MSESRDITSGASKPTTTGESGSSLGGGTTPPPVSSDATVSTTAGTTSGLGTTSTTATSGGTTGPSPTQFAGAPGLAQDRVDVVVDRADDQSQGGGLQSVKSAISGPAGRRALAVLGAGAGTFLVGRTISKRRAAAQLPKTNPIFRTLHDVGLAAWFGGTLNGAVGVNGAAADVDDPRQRARVANAGWARWTPVNLAAIAAHLIGGAGILYANKGRTASQKGVAGWTAAKLGLTAAALGATAYSRVLGQKMMNAGDVPVEGGTSPSAATPPEVEKAQRQLQLLQWAIPALTGGVLVSAARMSEQQRPTAVIEGLAKKLVD